MQITFILFVSSVNRNTTMSEVLTKTIESDFRPVAGDVIDDPGFDSRFHNGYEVVKVTINYMTNECLVSLSPLAIEVEEIQVDEYIKKLQSNGWRVQSI